MTQETKDLNALQREINLNALPSRREYLQTLNKRREVLLSELEETETLLRTTLLFETEEEKHLQTFIKSLRKSLGSLDKGLVLLEENIRRVEDGNNL